MNAQANKDGAIVGLWVDEAGRAHVMRCAENGARQVEETASPFFCWATASGAAAEDNASDAPSLRRALKGEGAFSQLCFFDHLEALRSFTAACGAGRAFRLRCAQDQYLLQNRLRMFQGLRFSQLRRMQVDIETYSAQPGTFPNPRNPDDRVLAIGLRDGRGDIFLKLEALTDAAERALLEKFNTRLQAFDPDVVEGHNIFKFDLEFLRQRCRRLKVPCAWGRFGQPAAFRNSRLKVAERTLDFPRCDMPGRTVFDTYLALQLYDIANRDLPSYSLKNAAIYFGFTTEKDGRTYLPPAEIQRTFFEEADTFFAYLRDDLRETAALADFLLPAYFAQAKNLPMDFQEICLRGNAQKIETLFLEQYFAAGQALPAPPPVNLIEGGFARGFREGVFHNVLHFDVASMYPSLLLAIGRNPAADTLGVFIPLLKQLRSERLHYKQLARTAPQALRAEYAARQASFKVLINSFYGYLAFAGARFADSDLAAEVTRRGRDLIQQLVETFERMGLAVLEADTDGVYVEGGQWFETPEALLEKVRHVLPDGIDLEYDGAYPSMWCYKAKNYALYDGKHVALRGSALRSRAMEPFLRRLNDVLIAGLLGVGQTRIEDEIERVRAALAEGKMDPAQLAKTEFLSMSPAAYAREVQNGKPRRASLEVALRMNPPPRQGERVRYYIGRTDKARAPDWQAARPLDQFDPQKAPYDPDYYLRKLADWRKRYDSFIGGGGPKQGELL